ncbi:MAG: abortive infection family protein [Pseudomonas sp.]|nr:abortive infection family protein [Pseudomonas sp.]
MSLDWCPGIREACVYWHEAEMLQHTFKALEDGLTNRSDATIDACKGLVECVCRVIIDELDDPKAPLKPIEIDPSLSKLLGAANRLLKLSDIRHRKFADLVKHHNNIADSLRELRNEAGPTSHGKDGFIDTLSVYHQRAAVMSADAIVTFLHHAYLEAEKDLTKSREPYERFGRLHELVDATVSMQAKVDDSDGFLVVDALLPTGESLPIRVSASRLLYQLDRDAYIEALNIARSIPASAAGPDEEQGGT